MLDVLRDLMTPEAQANAYEWAAVLLAHFAIGVCLRFLGLSLWLIAAGYAAFEAVQAMVSGVFLPWDSAVDWVAVVLGAAARGPAAVAALSVVALVGAGRRR